METPHPWHKNTDLEGTNPLTRCSRGEPAAVKTRAGTYQTPYPGACGATQMETLIHGINIDLEGTDPPTTAPSFRRSNPETIVEPRLKHESIPNELAAEKTRCVTQFQNVFRIQTIQIEVHHVIPYISDLVQPSHECCLFKWEV